MNNIVKFALILFLVNFVASTVLAGVYIVTKDRILKEQRLIEEEALKEVMPESVGNHLVPVMDGKNIKYWKVFKDSDSMPSGYIFIAKKYGYSSVIESMVGIKKDGTITGIRILSQNETPGLGAKMVEIISDETLFSALKGIFLKTGQHREKERMFPHFTEQFKNVNIRNIELSKNNIHAITGATISSRALLGSVKQEGLKVLNEID